MIQFVLLAIAALILVAVTLALLVSVLMFLAMACAIGIPVWLFARHWMHNQGISRPRQSTMDHLKSLYIEGKIDLFEFERRVAHLISAE